jgi:hypothetical protein
LINVEMNCPHSGSLGTGRISGTVPANTADTRQYSAHGALGGPQVHASAGARPPVPNTRIVRIGRRMMLTVLTPRTQIWSSGRPELEISTETPRLWVFAVRRSEA